MLSVLELKVDQILRYKIGKPKKFLLLKEIYNRIKVITTINYGKQHQKLNVPKNDSIVLECLHLDLGEFSVLLTWDTLNISVLSDIEYYRFPLLHIMRKRRHLK